MAKATLDDVRAVLLAAGDPRQKIDNLERMLLPDPSAPEVTNDPTPPKAPVSMPAPKSKAVNAVETG